MQQKFNFDQIKLIISLGNPDRIYENTYHNVGHLFVDYLKIHKPLPAGRQVKTDCYMNTSGSFVIKNIKKRGVKTEELLIAHDDSDINIGDYKLDFGRGGAGHKGVESIIKALKTKNFWRLRIGIRPKKVSLSTTAQREKAGDFVLKKIASRHKKILEDTFKKIERDYFSSI